MIRVLLLALTSVFLFAANAAQRLLYVATPGIRNYQEYGGHGIIVFDIDREHRFVKRIPLAGLDENKRPLNVKGFAASAETKRLYVTTTRTLTALDMETEKILWEKSYAGGCDRLALSPDGNTIYLPSLEQGHWHVVEAESGKVLARVETASGAHNTLYSSDGKFAYLAGLRSPLLRVADASTHSVVKEVGPFGNFIRPFTVNGRGTRCYVNLNALLGFEVGDLASGKMLHRVEVEGFKTGAIKRHGCPSHGVGLTPDEREIWLCDAHNRRLHVYDNTVEPPKPIGNIELRDEPGWVTFTIDGQFAYPSTGDIIDVKTKKIIGALTDENGTAVQSEKLLEIQFENGKAVRAGNQFGIGRVTK